MECGGPSEVGLHHMHIACSPSPKQARKHGCRFGLGAGAVRCSDSAIFEKVGASATGYVY